MLQHIYSDQQTFISSSYNHEISSVKNACEFVGINIQIECANISSNKHKIKLKCYKRRGKKVIVYKTL